MLYHYGDKALDFAAFTVEYLTLAVLYILLYVQSDSFRYAEIFHGLGHVDAQLGAKSEEVVNCVTRGEYDSCVVENGDLLLSELLRAYSFYLNKLLKINSHTKLACDVKIGRFVRCRFRL